MNTGIKVFQPKIKIGIDTSEGLITVSFWDDSSLVAEYSCDANTAILHANMIWENAYRLKEIKKG